MRQNRLGAARQQEPQVSGFRGALWQQVVAPAGSSLPLPRLLVVLAHPDDEVLALGARLERLARSRLVTLTDGSPRDGADARQHGYVTPDAYRDARHAELVAALTHAGLSAEVAAPFAALQPVPDQEASLHLVGLTQALRQVIEEWQPDAVLTHPYEGGHPDHDACAFAVHTALRLVRRAANDPADPGPLLLETPFYHQKGIPAAVPRLLHLVSRRRARSARLPGSTGRRLQRRCEIQTGEFLDEARYPACVQRLSAAERQNKRDRLACFPTQASTLQQFPTDREAFRLAPAYNFHQPPHAGQLFYECFPWGMTGGQFRSLAAEAEHLLLARDLSAVSSSASGFAR